MRALAALVIAAVLALALLAGNRSKPFLVDARSPGAWNFNNADYPLCVTVQPPPVIKAPGKVPMPTDKSELS